MRPSLRSSWVGLVVPLVVEPAIGAPYLTVAHRLRDFAAWPQEARDRWQRERLDQVLAHARAQVPFYRALLGPDAAGVGLSDLPVVSKRTIRDRLDEFLSRDWQRIPSVHKRTGGTGGEPWQYPLDKRAWTQIYAAGIAFNEQTGYRYGDPIVLMGTPASLHPESVSWQSRLRLWLEGRVVSTAGVSVDPEVSLERALIASRHRSGIWYGYASAFNAMAHAVMDAGVQVRGPKAIVSTAEPLTPDARRAIEDAFRVPVYDQYGVNDGGLLSQTCLAGNFHLAENVSIVEILDGGTPCPPGIDGDVVVTNLHARTLPFLRYRVGDRAAWLEGRCPCGRPGRVLSHVSGREGDVIELGNGRRLVGPALAHAFWDTRNVRAWQVAQPSPDELVLRLEVGPGFGDDEWRMIETALRRQCGDGIAVAHTTTVPLARTPGGKQRVVVREF